MTNGKKLSKPKYNEFVKFNLEQRDIAEELIKQALPQELANLSEFDKMQLEPSEYIDPELRELISDVLWSVPIKGKRAYVYFLIEHDSDFKGHDLLPFRFHKYLIRIMEKHLAKGNDKLPIVMPILLYYGSIVKYPHSISIFNCFENKTLAQKYAFNNVRLIDLTVISDDEIAKKGFRFFFEFVLKCVRVNQSSKKLIALFSKKLIALLKSYPELTNYFECEDFKKAFVNLLMSLDLDSEQVANETLKKLDNLTGVDIMSLKQQWEEKAQKKGSMLKV